MSAATKNAENKSAASSANSTLSSESSGISNPEWTEASANASNPNEPQSAAGAGTNLKPTFSQTTMNSHILNSLPKYIFQTDHAALKSVTNILNELKEQLSRDEDFDQISTPTIYEVSEYPIAFIENQQHAIQRHMSIKWGFLFLSFFFFSI